MIFSGNSEIFGVPLRILFMGAFFCMALYIFWNVLANQKKIRIWVIVSLILCAGCYSIYEFRIAYNVRYTIGVMLSKTENSNTTHGGTIMMNVFSYSVNGIYYEGLFYAPDGFVINIDKKYVIRYSIDYPSLSKILLDHPIDCSFINIPDTGWSKIP